MNEQEFIQKWAWQYDDNGDGGFSLFYHETLEKDLTSVIEQATREKDAEIERLKAEVNSIPRCVCDAANYDTT